jgi:hypothetical protein
MVKLPEIFKKKGISFEEMRSFLSDLERDVDGLSLKIRKQRQLLGLT